MVGLMPAALTWHMCYWLMCDWPHWQPPFLHWPHWQPPFHHWPHRQPPFYSGPGPTGNPHWHAPLATPIPPRPSRAPLSLWANLLGSGNSGFLMGCGHSG
eukprot:1626718-Rhodomonas_salina.2